ncbi:class I SAM-dependent methyltransferase [Amorphus orientalis]|uniref:O-methyltransferase YrrM n=1 Tax=Amorphus orientalis TaxID=649198 RepID=A0AAE4AQF0_9HYPH|nr:class I SAM-dependent methyltransferase [Amorphus orientalis]MDQ0314006.1 putative O-methyltransferase YrrM [Amorphus orientalis]
MKLPGRSGRRRLSFGLQTVLGIAEKGFFIPHRHAPLARPVAARPYDALERIFEARNAALSEFIDDIDRHADDLEAISGLSPPEPRFEQDWFPRLDAAALYTFVRTRRPRRILEVGSGHSTRFLARAVRDGGLDTHIGAIDPQPRADISRLPVTLDLRPLQEAGDQVGSDLEAGDFLFCDSSHVLMPGTDVDIVVNRLLPALPEGAYVGFHDIFLPAPYPDAWPFTTYNEQLAIAALLQGGYEIEFASAYARAALDDRLSASVVARLPIQPGARESLIILRKTRPTG